MSQLCQIIYRLHLFQNSLFLSHLFSFSESIVNQADWQEKRSREEKLVADIIDRVRRECEAQPKPDPPRRPYARRATTATVMHTMRQTDALT